MFTVDGVREYPRADFPAQIVYGPATGANLRLVTCGGNFDPAHHSYLDNIVVTAHLTAAR